MADAATTERNAIAFPIGQSREQVHLSMAMDAFVTNIIVMKRLTDLTWPDADLTSMAAEARFLASRIRKGDLSTLESTIISQASLMSQAWTELMDRWTGIMKDRPKDIAVLAKAKNIMEQACMVQDRFVRTSNALRLFAKRNKIMGARARESRVVEG